MVKNSKNKKIKFIRLGVWGAIFCVGLGAIQFNSARAALNSSGCTSMQVNKKEIIYERLDCQYCQCNKEGDKLFGFFGAEADCQEKDTKAERFECFKEYSYPRYNCKDKQNSQKADQCMKDYLRYEETPYQYYLGGSGTFVNKRSLTVKGGRTYISGFKDMEHNFYTGLLSRDNVNPLTFIKNSRNVLMNRDIKAEGGVEIPSSAGGVFLDADISFGDIEYQQQDEDGDKVKDRIRGITDMDRSKGIGSQGVGGEGNDQGYKYIQAGSKKMLTFQKENNEDKVFIKKGAQVRGGIESQHMFVQDKKLYRSKPIRGHYILYYKTD